jgi:hypothetical protein
VVALDANVTVAGTVATAVLLELKLTVNPPAGAGPDRVSVRFCGIVPLIVSVDGEKPIDPVVVTCCVAAVYPAADAPIVAAPRLTPVTCG